NWMDICPVIKKIWTPSWTIYSTGWCLLFLAGFYAIVDVWGWRRPFFPMIVLGVNSIGVYVLGEMIGWRISGALGVHFNKTLLRGASEATTGLVLHTLAALVLWLFFFWMYRRKIFLRI